MRSAFSFEGRRDILRRPGRIHANDVRHAHRMGARTLIPFYSNGIFSDGFESGNHPSNNEQSEYGTNSTHIT